MSILNVKNIRTVEATTLKITPTQGRATQNPYIRLEELQSGFIYLVRTGGRTTF